MSVHEETSRRLSILHRITRYLETHAGPVVSSRVGGSLAFAQNHAIREDSDIDLDIFVPFDQLAAVNHFLEYIHADMRLDGNSAWQNFDLIAVDAMLDGVAINLWVLNTKTFDEIARFQRDNIVFYSEKQPSPTKDYKVFGGGTCSLGRNVEPFGHGYKSDRPFLHDGQLLSENYVLNNMFFVFPIFGADYSKRAVDEMWNSFLKKYPSATEDQIHNFIIDRVTSRFSPRFKAKLDESLRDRLSHTDASDH